MSTHETIDYCFSVLCYSSIPHLRITVLLKRAPSKVVRSGSHVQDVTRLFGTDVSDCQVTELLGD